MRGFRIGLSIAWAVLLAYTGIVIAEHGMGLLPIFFGDMARLGWPGQFNLDFTIMLGLSATWVAWRHRFSAVGLALAVVAFFGGAGFLCPYLLIASAQAKGDPRLLLLGRQGA